MLPIKNLPFVPSSLPPLLISGVSIGLALPLLLATGASNYAWDEAQFHLPAIRQIAAQWPRLDVVQDSLSATAPGYHYMLAAFVQVTGDSTFALRIINLLVSVLVPLSLWFAWPGERRDARLALAALSPLVACNFFVKSSAYIVTDNAALLLTGLSLIALLWGAVAQPGRSGLWAAGACLVRQSSAWLVVGPALVGLTALERRRRLMAVLGAALPSAVVAYLVWRWGGLVPAAWRDLHLPPSGVNHFAPLVYMLSLCAVFGGAFLPTLPAGVLRRDSKPKLLLIVALIALGIAAIGRTDYDYEAGRWGGYLWDASRYLPQIGGRSLLFLALAPLGAATVMRLAFVLWNNVPRANALMWLACFAAWVSASAINQRAFHRYYEPTLLLFLILWLGLLEANRAPGQSPFKLSPLVLLGAAQLAITVFTAHARTFHFY